jgi:hypothetical protein
VAGFLNTNGEQPLANEANRSRPLRVRARGNRASVIISGSCRGCVVHPSGTPFENSQISDTFFGRCRVCCARGKMSIIEESPGLCSIPIIAPR